jgi:hypothetical protein
MLSVKTDFYNAGSKEGDGDAQKPSRNSSSFNPQPQARSPGKRLRQALQVKRASEC